MQHCIFLSAIASQQEIVMVQKIWICIVWNPDLLMLYHTDHSLKHKSNLVCNYEEVHQSHHFLSAPHYQWVIMWNSISKIRPYIYHNIVMILTWSLVLTLGSRLLDLDSSSLPIRPWILHGMKSIVFKSCFLFFLSVWAFQGAGYWGAVDAVWGRINLPWCGVWERDHIWGPRKQSHLPTWMWGKRKTRLVGILIDLIP